MSERRTTPVYLSLEEAAECMSVSVKTIRRWMAAGTSRRTGAASEPSGSSWRTLKRLRDRSRQLAGRRPTPHGETCRAYSPARS